MSDLPLVSAWKRIDPLQWEAKLQDGRKIDIFYRHGLLIAKHNGKQLMSHYLAYNNNDNLTTNHMMNVTGEFFNWDRHFE